MGFIYNELWYFSVVFSCLFFNEDRLYPKAPGCVAQARLKKEPIILPQPLIDRNKILSHHVYFKNFKNNLRGWNQRTQPGLTCLVKDVQSSSIVFFLAFTCAELWILSKRNTGYKELTETKWLLSRVQQSTW